MAPERWFVETLLFKSVKQLAVDLKAAEFLEARNWNKAQGFIATRRNTDYDEDEWKLTAKGLKKEGL